MYWPLACDNSCLLASPPFVYVAKRENASPFISSAAYCAWLLANSPNREHARRQIGHCLVVFGFLHPKISQYKLPWHMKHPPLSFFSSFSFLFFFFTSNFRLTNYLFTRAWGASALMLFSRFRYASLLFPSASSGKTEILLRTLSFPIAKIKPDSLFLDSTREKRLNGLFFSSLKPLKIYTYKLVKATFVTAAFIGDTLNPLYRLFLVCNYVTRWPCRRSIQYKFFLEEFT